MALDPYKAITRVRLILGPSYVATSLRYDQLSNLIYQGFRLNTSREQDVAILVMNQFRVKENYDSCTRLADERLVETILYLGQMQPKSCSPSESKLRGLLGSNLAT